MEKVDTYAKIIWDYMHMGHILEKSDIILCLGSRDMLPAERACELYFQGLAPVIMFSGNHPADPKKITLDKPEAEVYKDIAIKLGVPEPAIVIENKSTNPHDEKERIIHRMVGDLQRIKEYPKLGFQIEQEIPEHVWGAYSELVKMGYNQYLIK